MTSAKHSPTLTGSADPPLRLKLFGPFEALLKGDPLLRLRSRKGLELLALLALYGGQVLSREWLAETLWPESLPEASLASLRVTLSDLAGSLGDTADLCLQRSRKTLGLRSDFVHTDLAEFRMALQTGDPAALRSALALYQRPLLEGWDEPWLLQDREETGRQYAAALEALSNHALQHGEPAEAVQFLQKAVLADPLHQAAQRQLMNLLAASGDYKAADQCYQRFKETLYERLGAEPEPETTQLHRQIRDRSRRTLRTLDVPRAAGTGKSEEVLSGRSVCRAPQPLTRLIGRDGEMAAVAAGLAGSRLVTLTGPGGVGKTRLALETAHRCADEYADGAWFVDLSGTSDPRLLPAVLASSLGIPDASGRASSDDGYRAVSEALSSREMLLVLDNVERLVEALSRFILILLPIAPRLRVLATGRQRLGISGERVLPVTPLAVPAAAPAVVPENPGAIDLAMQSAAVQLFVERALALCPAFRLTLENIGSVTQICRHLEGLPLALELTAAFLETLSPAEIADRLKRQASLPAADSSRPERHQTLSAAIDWSWDQLTSPERTLFRRLSVFQGGWTLESAEQVCADGWNRG
ncbi:MAG: AAA family ATPase, partial [Chloroflexi bacterium]|nr:AAA family ATPase [Chloroflexota bacterium]